MKWRTSSGTSSRRSRKRRHPDGEHVQPVIEVLAEAALVDEIDQVLIGGRDQAEIDLDRAACRRRDRSRRLAARAAASPGRRAAARRSRRGTACPGRLRRICRCASPGAGEGALLMAEQDALDQIFGDRAAIDGDEGLADSRALSPWMARAISSLPTPLSPSIRTGMVELAARCARARAPASWPRCRRSDRRSRARPWPRP